MAEPSQAELVSQALKATQQLRASVSQVFEKLSDGIPKSGDGLGNGNAFLSELQHNLKAVNKDLGDIEKVQSTIQSTGNINLGNSSYINLDPIVDKTSLHTQVINSYKWANKLHECASIAQATLHHSSLKRSITGGGGPGAKRVRKIMAPTAPVPNNHIDTLVQQQWDRLAQDMSVSVVRPFGNPAVLQIKVGKILQAAVVLRGLCMEWCQIKGTQESMCTENGKLDIWTPSKYKVFRKVTDHASAAMLHFYFPQRQEIAIKSFLLWLHSYISLFSVQCRKCENYLRDNLPPTWRDYRSCEPYHEACRL